MADTKQPPDEASSRIPTHQDVIRIAKTGDKVAAIKMYRQIHNVGLAEALAAVEELADLPRIPKKTSNLILSPATKWRVNILFPEPQRAEATRLLMTECGNNLPGCNKDDEFQMERIRFAALKQSEGDLQKLREAIHIAKIDWRDFLCSAGFGHDIHAHKHWFPKSS